ncbi:hypothetical protein BCT54_11290 [Vibrio splendidus]|uniref:Uncharacterized protein n=1 Tax=Vibrio splendidus TaxID=29497 RepID=A0A2N7JK62_VIBSP|nr:hypothetical protein BCT54_11290 [Vibrio splendidus]
MGIQKHDTDGKCRVWRKLNIAVDASNYKPLQQSLTYPIYTILHMKKHLKTHSNKHADAPLRYVTLVFIKQKPMTILFKLIVELPEIIRFE